MIPALTPVPTTSSTATRDFVNIKVSPPPAPVHARTPLDHVLTRFCLLSGTPWNGATTSDLLELVAIDGLASNGMPLPNCYPIPQPPPQAQDLLELVAIDGLASNGMPLPNCTHLLLV